MGVGGVSRGRGEGGGGDGERDVRVVRKGGGLEWGKRGKGGERGGRLGM